MSENSTEFEGDFFCEQRFWHDVHKSPPVTHPMAALTGVIMILMPLFHNVRIGNLQQTYNFHSYIPRQFQLCKSTLALTGVGTIIFHSISADQSRQWHINYHMCDWMPITLMGNSIIVLYVSNLFEMGETQWTVLFFVICCWSSGLALLMDSDTEHYYSSEWGDGGGQMWYGTTLNIILLLPLGLTLAYACYSRLRPVSNTYPLWCAIAVVLVLWVTNAYACVRYSWMSTFHALYHLVISYVFIYAACLGVSLDEREWAFCIGPYYWPMIEHAGVNSENRKDDPASIKIPTNYP